MIIISCFGFSLMIPISYPTPSPSMKIGDFDRVFKKLPRIRGARAATKYIYVIKKSACPMICAVFCIGSLAQVVLVGIRCAWLLVLWYVSGPHHIKIMRFCDFTIYYRVGNASSQLRVAYYLI